MDGQRFDLLTKSVAAPTSRRRALGTVLMSGLLGGLGARAHASLAQAPDCILEFVGTVRTGPTAGQVLTTDSAQPGEVRGELRFGLTETGGLQAGSLRLADGTELPVVGHATGHSLQLRIDAGQGLTLIALGVGENEVGVCQGALDGVLTGPQAGDLGDWHATAISQAGGTTNPAGCDLGLIDCGGICVDLSSDTFNCGACGNNCLNLGPALFCQAGTCVAPQCPAGTTDCGGYCADLLTSPVHCGACGVACAADQTCQGGVCTTVAACAPGLTLCSGVCVDLLNDVFNCGQCGVGCLAGPGFCAGGACQY